jgi:hypothetical protein
MKNTDSALPVEPDPPIEPTKSPVRFNATRHGILSVSPVVPLFEKEADWRAFRDSIFESINPQGGLEIALVDRSAAILWRMMRVLRYEREVITASISSIARDMALARSITGEKTPEGLTRKMKEEMDSWAMARLLPGDADLNKIMRYETRLHRHLLQTLHQLYALRAGPVPKRIRTDIEHTDIRRIGVHSPRLQPPAPHH